MPFPHQGSHVVLICLFYLVLALAFAAAEWLPIGSGIFLTSVAGALLCGLLIAYSRANASIMFGFGLLASWCWILFQVSTQIPDLDARALTLQDHSLLQARAFLLLNQWWTWIRTVLQQQTSSDTLVFLFNMSFLLWWITYFGTWTLLRYGQTWRTILTAGIVTAVNTYYAPAAITAPATITLLFVLFVLVALMLLASAHLVTLQAKWQREGIRYPPDIVFDFMRNALIFSLIAVSVAWSIPKLGLLQALNRWLQPASIVWEDTTDRIAQWNQGLNQQIRGAAGSFQDTLTLGGERQTSPEPVLYVQVQSDSDQVRYWRANVYDSFNGTQWRNTLTDHFTIPAHQTIAVPPWQRRQFLRQTFLPQQDLGYVVLAAPNIMRTTLPTIALYETVFSTDLAEVPESPDSSSTIDHSLSTTQDLLYVKSKDRLTPETPYEVTSALTTVTVWDLEQASDHIPEAIRHRYLQLPETIEPRVSAQAMAWIAGETTRYGQVKALERALRHIPYDDRIAAPPPGVDPVAYFLFDLQRGYCDYYATTMVVMLRILGIPARLAVGYAQGVYEPDTSRFLVTEEDAHSWVEVYFGEMGWIEFEPTAGESIPQREPGGPPTTSSGERRSGETQPSANPQDQMLPSDGTEDWLEDLANPDVPMGDRPGRRPSPWIWVVILGGVLLSSAGLIATGTATTVGHWLFTHFTGSVPSSLQALSIVLRYQQLMKWARRLRIPSSSSFTPWERYSGLVRILPLLAHPLEAIVRAYVRYRYGTAPSALQQSTAQIDVERHWQAVQWPLWRAWLSLRLGAFLRRFKLSAPND